jgi:hypothetical protein
MKHQRDTNQVFFLSKHRTQSSLSIPVKGVGSYLSSPPDTRIEQLQKEFQKTAWDSISNPKSVPSKLDLNRQE